jgi:hypothetical protein
LDATELRAVTIEHEEVKMKHAAINLLVSGTPRQTTR